MTLRDMEHSDALVDYAKKRAAKLGDFFDRMTNCRVAIESPHRHQQHGRVFRVRVHMSVPGHDLIIERAPNDDTHTDAYAAIDDAFDQAGRVLRDYAQKIRGDVKTHERSRHGRVKKLYGYEGFGFIETEGGDEVYFHKNSVLNHGFERLKLGTKVRFVEEDGEKGPQASTVAIV